MLFLSSDCQSLSLLRFQVKMQYSGYYLDYRGFLDSRIRGNDRFFCNIVVSIVLDTMLRWGASTIEINIAVIFEICIKKGSKLPP